MTLHKHQIVLASGNQGKVREINELLAGLELHVTPQTEYGVPDIEETGLTFVENAILKARNAAQHTGLPAIADDSGLEVDALDGAPGIYSARYSLLGSNPGVHSGEGSTDQLNVQKLLADMKAVPEAQRTARFQCLLVYMAHAKDPTPIICQGTWEGRILNEAVGANGFGYDPVFYVPGEDCSAAQLPAEIKNKLSHRGQALQKLLLELKRIQG